MPTGRALATGIVVGPDLDVWVELQIVPGGAREIIPDLRQAASLDSSFLSGMVSARDYLRGLQTADGSQAWADDTDLRVSLAPKGESGHALSVSGRSMTALLAALGEAVLRCDDPVDLSCCISADLEHDGAGEWRLAKVTHIREKVATAVAAGLRRIVVAPGNYGEATRALREKQDHYQADPDQRGSHPSHIALQVASATTVTEAVSTLTRETGPLLRYLDAVAQRMVGETPLVPPEWRKRFFSELYQEQELRVTTVRAPVDPREPSDEDGEEARQPWDRYCLEHGVRRALVSAEAGHGKSTLMRWVTWRMATVAAERLRGSRCGIGEVEVPFFFRCRDLEDVQGTGLRPLEDSMAQALKLLLPEVTGDHEELLVGLLTGPQALIIWDALDEATSPLALSERLQNFAASFPGPRIHLTSRTRDLTPFRWPAHDDGTAYLHLAPFDERSLRSFIHAWGEIAGAPERSERLIDSLLGCGALQDIAVIPLYAVLACVGYLDEREVPPPASRVELLHRCVEQLDAVWERQHKQREYAKYGWARRQVLSEVAWHFAVVGQFGAFPEMELLDVLATQCAPGQPFAGRQPEDILDELSLLVSVEAAPMRQRQFLVRLFQEYFAAQLVARADDPAAAVAAHLHDPQWPEVIRLAAELVPTDKALVYVTSLSALGAELWFGNTPLQLAVSCNRADLVQRLLAQGAARDERERMGGTALHIAASSGNLAAARMLLEYGADVNDRDALRETPLHRAAIWRRPPLARLLLEHGAEVDARAGEEATPLHWAAQMGDVETMRALLDYGADVNAGDEGEQGPIVSAASGGSTEAVQLLLAASAEGGLARSDVEAALQVAEQRGHARIAEALEAYLMEGPWFEPEPSLEEPPRPPGCQFLEWATKDPPAGLDERMLRTGGVCYQFDRGVLMASHADPTGWLLTQVRGAMDQWAANDEKWDRSPRMYGVWCGGVIGYNRQNQRAVLDCIYICEYAEPPDTEDYPDWMTPFAQRLPKLPGYVRMESAHPLNDRARPTYLVQEREVTYLGGPNPYLHDEGDSDGAFVVSTTSACFAAPEPANWRDEGHAGAVAYLQWFVQGRRVRRFRRLPGAMHEACSPWLQAYFDRGACMFHAEDPETRETVMVARTDEPDFLMQAGMTVHASVAAEEHTLTYALVCPDPVESDYLMEFTYDLSDRGHLEELAQLALQSDTRLLVVQRDFTGVVRLVGVRTLPCSSQLARPFIELVAGLVSRYHSTAKLSDHLDAGSPRASQAVAAVHNPGLLEAARAGDFREVERRLQLGAALDARTEPGGQTPLHLAASGGHLEALRLLLGAGAAVDAVDGSGNTALAAAASEGSTGAVRLLLNAGACPDGDRDRRWSPLAEVAFGSGSTEVADALLDAGADPDLAPWPGGQPVNLAVHRENFDVARLLLQRGATPSLFAACGLGEQPLVERMLAAAVPVDELAEPGGTPLHAAAMYGHAEIAEMLIRAGADVDVNYEVDPCYSATPLHVAGLFGHLGVVRTLLAHGANTALLDSEEETPLQCAIERGHAEVADLLQGWGATA